MAATILLSDFYELETVGLTLQLLLDGIALDIRLDTVTLTLKETLDTDAADVLAADADVTSDGINGNAIFTLSPAETATLETRQYYYDIVWYPVAGGNYVLNLPSDNIVEVDPRVSGVTP